jgi:hypothetical protein
MASGIEKRIEALEQQVGSRRTRTITIKIPTLLTPIEGSVECASTVTPDTEAAVAELLRVVGFADEDTLIEIAHFYQEAKTNGHSEPVPIPSLELISVT